VPEQRRASNARGFLVSRVPTRLKYGGGSSASADRNTTREFEIMAQIIIADDDEIGVTGQLEVSMDGQEAAKSIGMPNGNDIHVAVVVEDLAKKTD
jgi:hypothetical protein